MGFPHRRALRARLRPFRYVDGIYLRISPSTRRFGGVEDKVMAGDPGHDFVFHASESPRRGTNPQIDPIHIPEWAQPRAKRPAMRETHLGFPSYVYPSE